MASLDAVFAILYGGNTGNGGIQEYPGQFSMWETVSGWPQRHKGVCTCEEEPMSCTIVANPYYCYDDVKSTGQKVEN